jgi:hypothetical protein
LNSYFQLAAVEEANLIELGLVEQEYIAKYLKKKNPVNITLQYSRDLVNLEVYNETFGGDNEPLARRISKVELIIAAYYYFEEGKRQ